MSILSLIHPVVLCGGSGTRLWPVSRKSFPKQFVPIFDNNSLLQLTIQRLAIFGPGVVTVSSDEHRYIVAEALDIVKNSAIMILEPQSRNSAAAMALAALSVKANYSDDRLILFCPSDHHIPDFNSFTSMVLDGVESAKNGAVVVFGVNPSYPSTAYGYIEQGDQLNDGSFKVKKFIEKPSLDLAQDLLLKGGIFWNAGIFLTRVDTIINALSHLASDILMPCQESMNLARVENYNSKIIFVHPEPESFNKARNQSIDYAVIEKYSNVVVKPFLGQWSDIGSWNAIAQLHEPDSSGNRINGLGLTHFSTNTFVHAPNRIVVALGTDNLLIIDTPDAVLVVHTDKAEQVKEVVELLHNKDISEALEHRKVVRPWGWYDSIDKGEGFQVKRISVKPGASLSLQKHQYRAEHWIVVKGKAEVTIGDRTFLMSQSESTYIPIGQVHRLRNPFGQELEIIEVQSGSYLGEDDIFRLDDNYGRS